VLNKEFTMFRVLKLALIVLFALSCVSVHAQEGMTDEQKAQWERALAAMQATKTYTTAVEESTLSVAIDLQIVVSGEGLGDMSIGVTGAESLESTTYRIEGDPRNLHAFLTSDVLYSGDMMDDEDYTLTGEVRLVDGVLYAKVDREARSGSDLDPIPDGWVIIDNPDDWPALESLSLDSYLESPDQETEQDILNMPDSLFDTVTGVSVEQATLDDGTPVDVVTLDIRGDELREVFSQAALLDSDLALGLDVNALMDQLSDDSLLTVAVSIDDQEQARQINFQLVFDFPTLDVATLFGEDLDGMSGTVGLKMEITGVSQYSGINEPLDPVAAPELVQ
jgi:hypothetical protein